MGHPASKLLSVRATRITQRARPNFIRILLRDRVSRKKTGQRQSAEKHLLGDTMTPAAKAALIFLALTAGLLKPSPFKAQPVPALSERGCPSPFKAQLSRPFQSAAIARVMQRTVKPRPFKAATAFHAK